MAGFRAQAVVGSGNVVSAKQLVRRELGSRKSLTSPVPGQFLLKLAGLPPIKTEEPNVSHAFTTGFMTLRN
jgi:hypothetical protein